MRKSILLLTILLLLTAVSCNTQQEYHEKNPTPTVATTTQQPVYTYDPDWTPMPQHTNSKGEVLEGNPYDYINPERVYNIGEWFDISDVYFRVNSVEITDSLEGINTEKLFKGDAELIKTGGMKLLIINLDVRNEREEAIDHCFANTTGWIQNKDVGYYITELLYYEPAMDWDDIKHANFYLFQPGEEGNFTLIEALYEPEQLVNMEEKFYIQIPVTGDVGNPVWELEGSGYLYDSYVVINKDKSEVDVYA